MDRINALSCRILFLGITLFPLSYSANGQSGNEWFSFNIPPLDTTIVYFFPEFTRSPIGNEHFVTVNHQGHFEIHGKQTRFWGTPISKNEAASLAKNKYEALIKECRKNGVNILRFHLWDSKVFNPTQSIFGNGTGTRKLDADALDRLDYLIFLMKQNGIYAYIDLLCDRKYTTSDGVYSPDSTYNAAKIVNFFDPKLIELQKEYAMQLLTHVNPYTGNSLVNEPTMAMMDIVNEGWLLHAVRSNQVKPVNEGGLMSHYHFNMLTDLWNDFLMEQYGTADAVRTAWGITKPEEVAIENGSFESGSMNWAYWGPAGFTNEITSSQSHTGAYSFHVSSTQASANNYDCQIRYSDPFFNNGVKYKIRFWAKSDAQQNIGYIAQLGQHPWTPFGSGNFTVSGDWTEYSATFTIYKSTSDVPYLFFNLGLVNGNLWIDDISIEVLQDNADRFELLSYPELLSAPQKNDQIEFYITLQEEYFAEMYDYLKNDLDVKIPVTGTNYLTGIPDVFVQRNTDFIDNHGYWDHWKSPQPASMISHPGYYNPVLGLFTSNRIAGKPLTVSEFNYESPNPFVYEALFFLAAYGSFHGADLLIVHQLEYTPSWDLWNHGFNGYQQISYRALQPTFAYAYRNNLISKANQDITVHFAKEDVLSSTFNPNVWEKDLYPNDYPYELAYQHGITIDFESGINYNRASLPALPSNPYRTDNGEIEWDNAGLFSINTPQLCGAVGKLDQFENKTIGAIKLADADKSAGITLLSLDDKPLNESERMLLTIVTQMKNTGMETNGYNVTNAGSKPRIVEATGITFNLTTSVDSLKVFWLNVKGEKSDYYEVFRNNGNGEIPITINTSLHPGVWFGVEKAQVYLPVNYSVLVTVSPVNAGSITGAGEYEENSNVNLIATPNDGFEFANWTSNGSIISTNPIYSFTIKGDMVLQANFIPVSTVSAVNLSAMPFHVFPNPANGFITITGFPDNACSTVVLYTCDGRAILQKDIENAPEMVFDVRNLKPGMYCIQITGNTLTGTMKIVINSE